MSKVLKISSIYHFSQQIPELWPFWPQNQQVFLYILHKRKSDFLLTRPYSSMLFYTALLKILKSLQRNTFYDAMICVDLKNKYWYRIRAVNSRKNAVYTAKMRCIARVLYNSVLNSYIFFIFTRNPTQQCVG